MTSLEDIAASYAAERSYQWDLGDVIDSSDSVLAIGNTKESTTELTDLSGTGNTGTINGCMPSAGFFMGRRFDGVDDYIDCGNDNSLDINTTTIIETVLKTNSITWGFPFSRDTNTLGLVYDPDGKIEFRIKLDGNLYSSGNGSIIHDGKIHHILGTYDGNKINIYVDGVLRNSLSQSGSPDNNVSAVHIASLSGTGKYKGNILFTSITNEIILSESYKTLKFNTLANLPFWSINYTDYPDNTTQYTDFLPYSSSIISSGTFKVDADVLNCVSAGTITYRAAHEFDSGEFIIVNKGLTTEFSGTGSATSGNTTVSVAQGSNKITVAMGTADTIDSINIQFRAEV